MVTTDASRQAHAKFEALYLAHYKPIYAFVQRRVPPSSPDVPDVVAEVFAVAWRRINDLPPTPQDRLWLFGVAHKCLLQHHRRRSRLLQLISVLGGQPNRIEILDGSDDPLHHRVREALLKLRPLDREVLILVYWDGLSHGDAASVLGCSVNAVASRVKKAKSRLEAQLSPRSSTMAPPHETSLPSTPKE